MKIKNYKCRCGHDDFFFFTPENCIGENHIGIYCSLCGKWFKWADKDEKRLAIEKNLTMNCVTKIRNDLVKNDDDLIKRQDAIEHIKKRLYESAENNIGLMCMADHVFTEIADNRINTWIEELPSAEPVIIRCKDCKHNYLDGIQVQFNRCELNHSKVHADDWFCANAERKEQ